MPMPCGTRRSPSHSWLRNVNVKQLMGRTMLACCFAWFAHPPSCTFLHAHAHAAKRSRDHRSAPFPLPPPPPSPALHLQAPMDYGSGLKRTEDDTRTPDQRRIEMVDATADKFMAMCVLCEHDFVVAVFVVHTKACGLGGVFVVRTMATVGAVFAGLVGVLHGVCKKGEGHVQRTHAQLWRCLMEGCDQENVRMMGHRPGGQVGNLLWSFAFGPLVRWVWKLSPAPTESCFLGNTLHSCVECDLSNAT
jgi:hypothetical protein